MIFNSNAQEQSPLADAFGGRVEIKNIRISPDGSKILMLTLYERSYILVTRSLIDINATPNGIPVSGGEYLWAEWATNERIVAGVTNDDYTDRRDNRELYSHMVSLDWTGENFINLATNRGRNSWIDLTQDRVYNWLPKDPDNILINIIGDVFKLNILTNEYNLVHEGNLKQGYHEYNDKGEMLYIRGRTRNSGNINNDQYRQTVSSEWVDVFDVDRHTNENPLYFKGLSSEPDIIFLEKYNHKGEHTLYRYNVETKQIVNEVEVMHDKAGITSYYVKDGKLNSYNYYDGKENTIYLGEIEHKVHKIMQSSFPNSNFRIIDETEDDDKFILFVSSPTEPGSYYLLDLNLNKLEMLGYIYQKVDPEQLSETIVTKFMSRDKVELQGFITFPRGKKENLPTVVLAHDGPNKRARWEFNPFIQFLASNGYAVLQINFRGSTGYGRNFIELAKEEWSGKIIEDINDGTKWVIEQGYADPNKICIYGENFGGYAALMATIKNDKLYQCAAVKTPLIDIFSVSRSERIYSKYDVENFRKKGNLSYSDVSINNLIDKINLPVFAINVINRAIISRVHIFKFRRMMSNENKDITLKGYFCDERNINCRNNYKGFLIDINLFLEKHLKN